MRIFLQPGPQRHPVVLWYQALGQPVLVPWLVGGGRGGGGGLGGASSLSWWDLEVFGPFLGVNDRQSDDGGQGSRTNEDPSDAHSFTDVEPGPHAARLLRH